MKIWIDADACPKAIKEILFRAAVRRKLDTIVVANHDMSVPQSTFIRKVLVPSGFDVADDHIVEEISAQDIVITADIPLAALVVEKGGAALNPRGTLYTEENVRERLSVRDFMQELRDSGVQTSGPPPFGPKDKQRFANAFDRLLAGHRD